MFRRGVSGRGAAGAGPLPRLQQAHPARAEHDAEGPGRFRTGFHSAHQRGKQHQTFSSDLFFCLFPLDPGDNNESE